MIGVDDDKNSIYMPRQYFPELKKACKMGISGAQEESLLLLQEGKI